MIEKAKMIDLKIIRQKLKSLISNNWRVLFIIVNTLIMVIVLYQVLRITGLIHSNFSNPDTSVSHNEMDSNYMKKDTINENNIRLVFFDTVKDSVNAFDSVISVNTESAANYIAGHYGKTENVVSIFPVNDPDGPILLVTRLVDTTNIFYNKLRILESNLIEKKLLAEDIRIISIDEMNNELIFRYLDNIGGHLQSKEFSLRKN